MGPRQNSEIPFDVKQTELFEFEAIITYIEIEIVQVIAKSRAFPSKYQATERWTCCSIIIWCQITSFFALFWIINFYLILNHFQSTNESRVLAVSGGIGHKYVVLGTIADRVLYFSYTTKIYGYFWSNSLECFCFLHFKKQILLIFIQ